MEDHRNIERLVAAGVVAVTLLFLGYLFATSTRDWGAAAFTLVLAAAALSPLALWWTLLPRLGLRGPRFLLFVVGAVAFSLGFFIYYDGTFVQRHQAAAQARR